MLKFFTSFFYGLSFDDKPRLSVPLEIIEIFNKYHIKKSSDEKLKLDLLTALKLSTTHINKAQKSFDSLLLSFYEDSQPNNSWIIKSKQLISHVTKHRGNLVFERFKPYILQTVLQFLIITDNPILISQRKELFRALYHSGFLKKEQNLYPLFKTAFKTGKAKALKDLLSFKGVIANNQLLSYSKMFHDTSRDNAFAFDLFHKLDPEEYKNKPWRKLTSYERIYWLVNEEIEITALSHRMGLEGKVTYQWQGHNRKTIGLEPEKKKQRELDIEGNYQDISLIQIKASLLAFLTHNKYLNQNKHQKVTCVVDKFLKLLPHIDSQYKYKLRDSSGHLFIFAMEDEHSAAGYHIGDTYYQINMGWGCDNKSGIQVYHVPQSKKELTHSLLCNLQYNHKTKHFNKIPQRCNLQPKYYLRLPEQISGNCSYECLKGLFAAILFDEFLKTHSPKKAYPLTMDIYRSFCEFDIQDAIVNYRNHALSINKTLLTIAYNSKERCLKKMVFKDKSFQFILQDSIPVVHHYTPMKKGTRVSVC